VHEISRRMVATKYLDTRVRVKERGRGADHRGGEVLTTHKKDDLMGVRDSRQSAGLPSNPETADASPAQESGL